MQVLIKLYPPLGEKQHTVSLQVTLPENGTVADAIHVLQKQKKLRSAISQKEYLVIINDNVTNGNMQLHDGDIVTLLPPMAGG